LRGAFNSIEYLYPTANRGADEQFPCAREGLLVEVEACCWIHASFQRQIEEHTNNFRLRMQSEVEHYHMQQLHGLTKVQGAYEQFARDPHAAMNVSSSKSPASPASIKTIHHPILQHSLVLSFALFVRLHVRDSFRPTGISNRHFEQK